MINWHTCMPAKKKEGGLA